jgi:hypothetical protein
VLLGLAVIECSRFPLAIFSRLFRRPKAKEKYWIFFDVGHFPVMISG